MTIDNILDKCVHWYISREQRITETERGLDLSGTSGYEVQGCYECLGDESNKQCYMLIEDLEITKKDLEKINLYEQMKKL